VFGIITHNIARVGALTVANSFIMLMGKVREPLREPFAEIR
jgi:hypothetical protein